MDESHTDYKLLGFCDGIDGLEKIKEKALKLSGFNKYPNSFVTNKYILDKINWENGFEKVTGEIGKDYLLQSDDLVESFISIKELDIKSVFSVSHSYTVTKYLDDERMIGIFSSLNIAEQTIEQLKKQSGFKNHPEDFIVDEIELNELLWTSGF